MASLLAYRPLDIPRKEIRLLQISPLSRVENAKSVSYTLHTVSLLDRPSFTALSYVWGDPDNTEDILVEGVPFKATVNLAAALRQAVHYARRELPCRDAHALRYWADAICIDQSNPVEKYHQIPLMRSIYSSAELVVSSVGHGEDEDLTSGLQVLKCLMSSIDHVEDRFGRDRFAGEVLKFEWLRGSPLLRVEEDAPPDTPNRSFQVLRGLTKRPYFGRVWIAQEMILSTRNIIVDDNTSIRLWEVFRPLVAIMMLTTNFGDNRRPDFIPPPIWRAISRLEDTLDPLTTYLYCGDVYRTDIEPAPMELRWAAHLMGLAKKAKLPHDHVYGLLGVVGDVVQVEVDYAKPIGDVLVDLVVAHLNRGGIEDLDEFLSLAGAGRNMAPDGSEVPSWVPTPVAWGTIRSPASPRRKVTDVNLPGGDAPGALFRMDGPGPLQERVIIRGRTLGVKGIRLQSVAQLYAIGSASLVESFKSRDLANVPGLHPLQVLCQTLLQVLDLSSAKRGLRTSSPLDYLQGYPSRSISDEFNANASAGARTLALTPEGDESFTDILAPQFGPEIATAMIEHGAEEFVGKIGHENCDALTLFETKGRYLGVGPGSVLLGDVVFILSGCRAPVILRKAGEHYVHVGTCFILGLMSGEIEELVRQGEMDAEVEGILIH